MKRQVQKAFGLILIIVIITQNQAAVADTFGRIIDPNRAQEQIGPFNIHDLPKELAENIDTYLPSIRDAMRSDNVSLERKMLIVDVIGHALLNKANPIEACDLLDVLAESYLNVAELRETCFNYLYKARIGTLPEWMEAGILHNIRSHAFDKYDIMLLGTFKTQASLSVLQEYMAHCKASDEIYVSAALARRTGDDEYASKLYEQFRELAQSEWTYNPVPSDNEPSAEMNDMIWLFSYIGTPLSLFTMYDNLITSPVSRPEDTTRLYRMPQSSGKTKLVWMLNVLGETEIASEIDKQRQDELKLWWAQHKEAIREILKSKENFPYYVAFRWGANTH